MAAYYEILGVTPPDSQDPQGEQKFKQNLTAKYYDLARKFHPDAYSVRDQKFREQYTREECVARFVKYSKAYEVNNLFFIVHFHSILGVE